MKCRRRRTVFIAVATFASLTVLLVACTVLNNRGVKVTAPFSGDTIDYAKKMFVSNREILGKRKAENDNLNIFNISNESKQARESIFNNTCLPYRTQNGDAYICVHPQNKDKWVSGSFISTGSYEQDLVNLTVDAFNKYSPMTLLDLGCNIGTFTIYFAKMRNRVIGVDANKENLVLLSRALSMGNLHQSVILIWNALSDTHENVILKEMPENKGGNYVIRSNESDPAKTVQTIMLDELAFMFHKQRLFIKMDIEGAEWRALNGGRQFFKNVDVRYVLMEFMFHSNHESGRQIAEFLADFGFRPHKTSSRQEDWLNIGEYKSWPANVLWVKV